MSKLTEQAIAGNKDYPHLDNHQIVLELVELEKRIESLENKIKDLEGKEE